MDPEDSGKKKSGFFTKLKHAEKETISALEAELMGLIACSDDPDVLAELMKELSVCLEYCWAPSGESPKESSKDDLSGIYLYLMDKAVSAARRRLEPDQYHRFCEKVDFLLF